MPKRNDIHSVLVIGAGPIVIGQAAEFDYSGTQACRVLRSEGLRVVLVNSNPATIMTDPEFADATYVEPITPEFVEKVIAKERPDALLATLGGQTALNTAISLAEAGVLEKYGVELIGASIEAINRGENRESFKKIVEEHGGEVARSVICHTMDDCLGAADELGYPMVVRPSFTMGGTGSGMAYDEDDLRRIAGAGLAASPTTEVLLEESIIGWKEYELEVMRDTADNVVIVCSIENLDPMGVHTGDSITVAPAMTLTDREYQRLRDLSLGIIREVGVDTGGCNIQFAVNPADGRVVVIEMNPRGSRSSALASKATGFPIAKIAAKLALGYTLDEIPNDIKRLTPASFEPTIDYIVVKVPRWAFEKFPRADRTLTTQMKSVGEVMAIGRTFKEAFMKAFRSLELGRGNMLFARSGGRINATAGPESDDDDGALQRSLAVPNDRRMWALFSALDRGWSLDDIHRLTKIDRWFLTQFQQLVELRQQAALVGLRGISKDLMRTLKRAGFGDWQLGSMLGTDEDAVRAARLEQGLKPAYKRIDTCAAEFESFTPYLYGTYEKECEAEPTPRQKVVILGSGPNRIGQGIEFDYCCVHAAFALREDGFETVMINCNPETVSTDYDTVDRLYFEPLTFEDVSSIITREQTHGADVAVVVQYGGQTPLKLALPLQAAGVKILGTSPDSIDLAEDRERFSKLLWDLGIPQAPSGTATSPEEARDAALKIGFPLVVRPSYVLGGRAMAIVYDMAALDRYMTTAVQASPERPVLIDKFLEDAVELDVDAVADATGAVVIGGIMEHIEEAGIHSGDSSCVIPPYRVATRHVEQIRDYTRRIARALNVIGLMNTQFAIKDDTIYVLEVNPRASRTVPYLSKATGVPLAKVAARVMVGKTLAQLGLTEDLEVAGVFVKTPVFPFVRFPGVDTILGPEMKSTGEVMGGATSFGAAFAKAQLAAGVKLPSSGTVYISVSNHDKPAVVQVARDLKGLGFLLVATRGTANYLRAHGIEAEIVFKVNEGRPHIGDEIVNHRVQLVINTPLGRESFFDDKFVRRTAMMQQVPCITTLTGAAAAVYAIRALNTEGLTVRSLQEYHADVPVSPKP